MPFGSTHQRFICGQALPTAMVFTASIAMAQEFSGSAAVDADRWMYPFNVTPGTRPAGSVDTWAFTFDLSNAPTGDLAFFFGNDGAHGSLDAVSVDVRSVPAPGALAVVVVAGVVGSRRRRA